MLLEEQEYIENGLKNLCCSRLLENPIIKFILVSFNLEDVKRVFKNLSYNYLPWANLCLPPHGAVPDGYHTCLSKAFGHTSSNTAPQEHH